MEDLLWTRWGFVVALLAGGIGSIGVFYALPSKAPFTLRYLILAVSVCLLVAGIGFAAHFAYPPTARFTKGAYASAVAEAEELIVSRAKGIHPYRSFVFWAGTALVVFGVMLLCIYAVVGQVISEPISKSLSGTVTTTEGVIAVRTPDGESLLAPMFARQFTDRETSKVPTDFRPASVVVKIGTDVDEIVRAASLPHDVQSGNGRLRILRFDDDGIVVEPRGLGTQMVNFEAFGGSQGGPNVAFLADRYREGQDLKVFARRHTKAQIAELEDRIGDWTSSVTTALDGFPTDLAMFDSPGSALDRALRYSGMNDHQAKLRNDLLIRLANLLRVLERHS